MMFANWGRLLVPRSAARYILKPSGIKSRIAVVITQRRTLAAAAGNKKPTGKSTGRSIGKTAAKGTTKKTAIAKKATPVKKAAVSKRGSAVKKTTRAVATKKATATKKAAATKKATATKKAPVKKTTASTRKTPGRKAPTRALAKKKAAAAKRPKKPVDPEERKKRKEKELVKDLKAKILNPPSLTSVNSTWIEFLKTKIRTSSGLSSPVQLKQNSEEWRNEYYNMSPGDLENLKQTGAKRKKAAELALKEWVIAHTPAEIHEANQARQRLRLMMKKDQPPHGLKSLDLSEIPDERIPKSPRNELIMFVIDRLKSFKGEGKEKMQYVLSIGKEYSKLSDADKTKYRELAAKDKARYKNEMKNLGIQQAPKAPTKKTAQA